MNEQVSEPVCEKCGGPGCFECAGFVASHADETHAIVQDIFAHRKEANKHKWAEVLSVFRLLHEEVGGKVRWQYLARNKRDFAAYLEMKHSTMYLYSNLALQFTAAVQFIQDDGGSLDDLPAIYAMKHLAKCVKNLDTESRARLLIEHSGKPVRDAEITANAMVGKPVPETCDHPNMVVKEYCPDCGYGRTVV